MKKSTALLGVILLLSIFSFGQATLTLNSSASQSIRLETSSITAADNLYWAYDLSLPSDDIVGLENSLSSDPTRARYQFLHAGILNSQISSIKLKITFATYNMTSGTASVRASMNNNGCNVSLPWNLSSSGGINSNQRQVYDCINLNAISPGGPNVSTSSSFFSTQEYVMYTRSANTTTNLQYVDPGSDNFTFNLTEIQGCVKISSVQAIIVYDVPAVSAPVISAQTLASGNQIKVSWPAVANATQYQIFTGTGTSPIQTVTGTTYTFTQSVGCIQYSYRVKAVNAAGVLSNFSNTASASTTYANPYFTTIYPQANQIVLAWNPISNVSSYTFSRGGTTLITVPGSQSSVAIPAMPGEKYDLIMSIAGTCPTNNKSLTFRTPFVAPTLTASGIQGTIAAIVCTNIQPRTTYVELMESATGNVVQTYHLPSQGSTTTYTFQLWGVQALTNYGYYARLVDEPYDYNSSPNSNTVSFTTNFANNPVITNVYSSALGPILTPEWTAVPNAISYELEEITSPPAVLLTTTTQTNYVHSGLGYGTTHTYRVRAKDASNNYTGYSNSFSRQTISQYTPPKSLMVAGEGTLEAYPNPVSSQLKITGGEDLQEGYVYATSGQLIKTIDLRTSSILDVSDLQPGTYFLKIKALNEEHKLMFVKE